MTRVLVEARGLSHAYGGVEVLRAVDLDVRAGELVAIVGPNGAGKSTLLELLLGFLDARRGEVRIEGRSIRELGRREIARLAAFVPQGQEPEVDFTVRDLVAMGRTPWLGRFQPESDTDRAAIEEAMEAGDLDGLASRPFSHLSGGERQRVLLARAFAQTTRVLLLDEPTASLDLRHAYALLALVRKRAEAGAAVVTALHDLNLAARFCDRIVALHDGKVAIDASPSEALTPELLALVFGVSARVRESEGGYPVVEVSAPIS